MVVLGKVFLNTKPPKYPAGHLRFATILRLEDTTQS